MIQKPVSLAGRGVMPDVGLRGVNGDGAPDVDAEETREWLDSLESVLQHEGQDRARFLLTELKHKAVSEGVEIPFTANTPYVNTIPVNRQPVFPGNRELERRIKSLVRWNATAMVVRANKIDGTLATLRRACTPAPSSKAGSPTSSWRTSAASCRRRRDCRATRTRG
jgi:hypothetical protein